MFATMKLNWLLCIQDEAASRELLNVLKKQPMTLQVLQVITFRQFQRHPSFWIWNISLWNAVLLFNPEFVICVIWILDMYISRIDFVISRNQFVISQIKFVISRILISDMYISRIAYVQIRDMYISRIQITHITNSGLNSKTAFHISCILLLF